MSNIQAIPGDMREHDISDEEFREYSWTGRSNYRIDKPRKLFMRAGGTTHRVLDSYGIVHCVPAVGEYGCVLRWQPKDSLNPVAF